MPKRLTSKSTLDPLKKDAKPWLKALRAGDRMTPEARVDIVLRHAWDGGDRAAAARLASRHPELAGDSLYTAIVFGDLESVKRRLTEDPRAAARKGGPLDWEPLLYLAYARLPIPAFAEHSLAMADLLFDHGADPNARFDDGWGNPFKVLTGVIGLGEGVRPPHPRAVEMADLLIARGADPFDTQALYNISIVDDDTFWLEYLHGACEARGESGRWRTVAEGLGGKLKPPAIDYLLGNAVAYDHLQRAEWLLRHGADPNGPHAYSGRALRDEALVYGHVEMAALLERHGAKAAPLEGRIAFQAACMRLDADRAREIAARDPSCLGHAGPMLIAARKGRADVVALLLDLGMNVDVMDEGEMRGIHLAAGSNAIDVARLLIAHGTDIDRPTKHYGGALGFASHFERREMLDFLAPLSRDVWNLAYESFAERLGELFAAEPGLVDAVHPRRGVTPLFCLPDDEERAADMAECLLAHGADPRVRNKEGETAEQAARKRGLDEAADAIGDAQ